MVSEPIEDYFSSIGVFIHRIDKIVSLHFLNDPGGDLLCQHFNVCCGTARKNPSTRISTWVNFHLLLYYKCLEGNIYSMCDFSRRGSLTLPVRRHNHCPWWGQSPLHGHPSLPIFLCHVNSPGPRSIVVLPLGITSVRHR